MVLGIMGQLIKGDQSLKKQGKNLRHMNDLKRNSRKKSSHHPGVTVDHLTAGLTLDRERRPRRGNPGLNLLNQLKEGVNLEMVK